MTEQAQTVRVDLQWDLSDRLRKALRVSGLGVQDMAEELGVERNTVGRYINGHTRPTRATLVVWALRSGVPLEWLESGVMAGTQNAPDLAVEGDQYAIRDSNPEPADLSFASLTDDLEDDADEQLREPRRYGHLTAHDGGGEQDLDDLRTFACPFRVIPGRAS